MNCANHDWCPLALSFRWAGRVLGLAFIAFVGWFLVAHVVFGEGPNPLKMNSGELILFVAFFAALAGMLVGWRWEVAGGLLVVGGMAAFFAVNRLAAGSWPGGWVLWLFPVPGVLYLLASTFDACRARQLKVSS